MVSAVAKSFRVLEAVSVAAHPVRLSALSAELGLQKSTVHRVLAELIDLGYVEQDDSGRYRATLRTWELGTAVVADLPIKQVASAAIRDLHHAVGETVSLVVRSGDDALYLDKLTAPRPMRFTTRVGSRVPLPVPAGGRALLAFADDGAEVLARFAERGGPSGVIDLDRIAEELVAARRRGFAISTSASRGVTSVAAPVLDRSDRPVAALAVSSPTDRTEPDRRDEIAGTVVATATRLSDSLGRL